MTDAQRERSGRDAPASGAGAGSAGPSIGQYLAQQRELRGISIQELCERTRIPRRNIERLESGALDDQLDGFARGFVRTLAEALGLDPDEAVMRLMREPDAGDEQRELEARRARRLRLSVLAVAALLLLVLGAVTLEWLVAGEEPPATLPGEREVTYRKDIVRSLAHEAEPPPAPPAPPAAVGGPPSPPAP